MNLRQSVLFAMTGLAWIFAVGMLATLVLIIALLIGIPAIMCAATLSRAQRRKWARQWLRACSARCLAA